MCLSRYAFITDDYFVYTANALGCVGGLMFNIICYAFAKEEVRDTGQNWNMASSCRA